MSDGGLNVAAEIAALRGEMRTSFAQVAGQLNLIAHNQQDTIADVNELEGRVDALEERRWPVTSVAALSGVVSAAVAFLALFVQQG